MPAWLRVSLSRLKAVFAKERLDREFDQELQSHLEDLTEEYLRRGANAIEARHLAIQKVGHPERLREDNREERGLPALENFLADTRYAVRTALLKPGFTCIVVISLGLGIGANTAVFSLVKLLLVATLPVEDPTQLVQVQRVIALSSGRVKPVGYSADELEIIARNSTVFSDVLGFSHLDRPVVKIDGVMEPPVSVDAVSSEFFATLGISMVSGAAHSSVPGAVISYPYWQSRFDGKADVLGRILEIDGHAYPIAGVAPSQFLGLEMENIPQIWTWPKTSSTSYEVIVGRLKPNVNLNQAQIATDALFQELNRREFGRIRIETRVLSASRGLSTLRGQFRLPLLALMVLVTLVLLITCTNVGTLLVVRNSARTRELAVRAALGASNSRLVTQLLVEGGILAAAGAGLAVFVARGAVSAILIMLPAAPAALEFHVDWQVLAFVAGISLLCTLLFALAPAWRATQINLTAGLKTGQGITMPRGTRRLGDILIAGQVGLSVVLLAFGGLFLQTMRNLTRADPGFDSQNLLQVLVDTQGSGYGPGQVGNLYRLLVERVAAIPGVLAVSGSRNPIMRGPLSGRRDVEQVEVAPDFFETMRIQLLRGRFLTGEDFTSIGFRPFPIGGGSVIELPAAVVISESLANQLFPGVNPVGQLLPEPLPQRPVVIGVVKDARFSGLRDDPRPPIYVAQSRALDRFNAIEVRTAGDPSVVARDVQEAVRSFNPRLLLGVYTMQEEMNRTIARERLVATISAFFSVLGLVLAGVGLFGVASHAVARRTNELGIRIALGASRWNVIRESLQDTLQVFGVGLIAGILSTFVGVRLAAGVISNLLFGLSATDSLTIILTVMSMIAVAILACLIPARRAATVDPVIAMRYE